MLNNFESLGLFVQVATEENISSVARRVGISQPALSRRIKALEEALGWQLLERGGKSVKLTRSGEVVLREGRRMVKAVEGGFERMTREIEGAEMRVGYAPSLTEGLVESAMREFVTRHPRVRVSWFDSSTEEMWRKLADGTFDFILEVSTNDPGIHWETLRTMDFKVGVPRDHRLAKRRFLRPADLDGERLLLLSRHDYPGYWEKVSGYFSEHGVNAKVAGEFDGAASLLLGLEAGLGIALVGGKAKVGSAVKLIGLKPKPDPICVALGHRAGRTLEEWEKGFVEVMKTAGKMRKR